MGGSRLAELVERCERDRGALAELRLEGDALAAATAKTDATARRWYIAVIRAVMADPPDGDAVRELYGELVDRYRDTPEHLAGLRELGDEIRALEAAGALPSTLVARSDRRKR